MLLSLATSVCAGVSGVRAQAGAPPVGAVSPAARAAADSGRPAFNDADVRFMSGMP